MRQKRAKQYRKAIKLLHLNFKFREPYQVLIDEEIVLEAVRTKYDLLKGIRSVLQGEIKPMITQCAVEALYKTKNQDAIDLAKKFERRRCGHRPLRPGKDEEDNKAVGTKSAFDCMAEVVNIKGQNKHRYVVATNKHGLRKVFKTIPAVPMIFLDRNVIIMEPLSDITKRAIALAENQKLTGGLNDPRAALKHVNDDNEEGGGDDDDEKGEDKPVVKKRKGPKEPNPLAIKKKKVEPSKQAESLGDHDQPKKRRRKHNRGVAGSGIGNGNGSAGEGEPDSNSE